MKKRKDNSHILPGSTNNLIRLYHQATPEQLNEGRQWYPTARRIAQQLGAGNISKGAGILAALSPQCDWDRNISDAWQLVERDSVEFQSTFNADRARRIRDAEIPSLTAEAEFASRRCRKVMAFYQSICQPDHDCLDWICIDTHATNAYVGRKATDKEKAQLDNVGVRERIQADYASAAEYVGESLTGFQAIVWTVARGMSKQAWLDFNEETDRRNGEVING